MEALTYQMLIDYRKRKMNLEHKFGCITTLLQLLYRVHTFPFSTRERYLFATKSVFEITYSEKCTPVYGMLFRIIATN